MSKTIKKMECTISARYEWSCKSFPKGIPQEIADILIENSEEHILNRIAEGYVEGELYDYVDVQIKGKKTPKDGWECTGYWVKIVSKKMKD